MSQMNYQELFPVGARVVIKLRPHMNATYNSYDVYTDDIGTVVSHEGFSISYTQGYANIKFDKTLGKYGATFNIKGLGMYYEDLALAPVEDKFLEDGVE